ncbi:MAG: DMT family transporter [Pseudomonadota bacterium]
MKRIDPERQSLPRGWRPTTAIAFMLGAGALVAATSLIAKSLSGAGDPSMGLTPFQISAGRFVFALLALLVLLAFAPSLRPKFAKAHWRWHVLRSISGWLGVTCMFAAVAHMPLAEATAISFLSPLVAMALSVLMLGERIGLRKAAAAGLGLLGAAFILRPGYEALQSSGILALAAAGFMGLETIFIKRLSDTEPALRILVINNAIGAVVSCFVAMFSWAQPTELEWGLLLALGVVMVSGQALFIQAMKRGDASLVMPAFYSVLAFAALYDFLIFCVAPSVWAALGAMLIASGAIVLATKRSIS